MKKIISAALVVLMMSVLLATAVLADGGSPSGYHTVTAEVKDGVGGVIQSVDPSAVPDGETCVIIAKPDDGYEFVGWTWTGEFDWIEGDANSLRIVIKPHTDVHLIAVFKGKGGDNHDQDPVGPPTGYSMKPAAFVIASAIVVSAAAAVYTGKKYYGAK